MITFDFDITDYNNIPVPRPRSISSKKSTSTNASSATSNDVSANSPISNKSSLQISRSVTPESVSIELSDSESIDSPSKTIPLKYN